MLHGGLAVGALLGGAGAAVAQHVVVAGRERDAARLLLAHHALGGRLQVEHLLYLLEVGARLGLERLERVEGQAAQVAAAGHRRHAGQRAARRLQLAAQRHGVRERLVALPLRVRRLALRLVRLALPRLAGRARLRDALVPARRRGPRRHHLLA